MRLTRSFGLQIFIHKVLSIIVAILFVFRFFSISRHKDAYERGQRRAEPSSIHATTNVVVGRHGDGGYDARR